MIRAGTGASREVLDWVQLVDAEIEKAEDKAVAGHTSAIRSAMHDLNVASLTPDEPDARQILGVVFGAFHAEPTQRTEYFIDTLVMELTEPEVDRPYCLPAIAAAARELWQTLPSHRPSRSSCPA